MNPNIFREYDIRGIADTDLTDDVVELIGKAYGTYMIERGHRIVSTGRDVRLTSERIQNALIKGILSTGMDVINIGMVTTPITYFSIVHLKTDGAVMVTGSHNPIEFNGIKMNEGLLSVFGDEIQKLKVMINTSRFVKGQGALKTEEKIIDDYKAMLKEKIHLARPFTLVIDAGNGTAGPIAPEVYEFMGCKVVRLYCEPDGRFPNHLPDPTVMENIVDLRKRMIQEKADFGLGYDGDADRVGVIDGKGRVVFADQLLAILAKDVLKRNPGATIIFDVKCSQMLPEVIEAAGGKPLMWKTGHSLIKQKMKELGSPLSGEMSGHIFFKDGFFGFDDGIYVSFRLVELLSRETKTLAEMVDELPQFVSTPEIRITCPDEDKFSVVDKLTEDFKKEFKVVDVDGARVQFGDGWGLVRVSNTQPILVLRFEAKTEKRLKEIKQLFIDRLSRFPTVAVDELINPSGHKH
jgi:phosphomannomutase / phosphoglucomutase